MSRGKSYLIVETRRPEVEKALRAENAHLKAELHDLREAFRRVENSLGEEVYVNGELIDLLRAHRINFRQFLDHRERERRRSG